MLILAFTPVPATCDEQVMLLLTSNLNGRFTAAPENQDKEDPMLVMAQSLIEERKKSAADLYIDLGNAFYPGLLSRFSYGSVTMDFLDYFDCAATLVSANDLNIGVNNLEFIANGKKTHLLSANIEKNGTPLFPPYFKVKIKDKLFTFIGITSEKGFFDIAEKQILEITLKNADESLQPLIDQIQSEGTDYIVLLSGHPYSDNLAMMKKYPQIALCISGGDATGELYAAKAERVDIDSGRSIVSLVNPYGYYRLTLSSGDRLAVQTLKFHSPAYVPTPEKNYIEFATRLTIWKNRFIQEGERELVADACCDVEVDDTRVAELMRHRFGAEVSILEKGSISLGRVSGRFAYLDILKMVDNEFPIFVYKLSGSELKQVALNQEDLVITGTDGDAMQGYPINENRRYLICSPQSVYDLLAKRFNREIPYQNSWQTISDLITEDLKSEHVIANEDYGYLDNRFRMLMDVSLSNFYDRSNVSKNESIDIPPGKPYETYQKWGLEDKIDLTIYNQRHQLILTPYIYYIRQNDEYFQNLLRGTLFYTYNLSPVLNPYHKSQVDTVVKKTDNLRPLLFRETFGALFETEHITGKMGLGFEKQTQDPEKALFSGIETIVDVKYGLLENLTYTLNLNTFYSIKRFDFGNRQIRAELTNALSFKLNSFLSCSAKYKWFYFYSMEFEEKYRDSQILLSLDLVTDFKIF